MACNLTAPIGLFSCSSLASKFATLTYRDCRELNKLIYTIDAARLKRTGDTDPSSISEVTYKYIDPNNISMFCSVDSSLHPSQLGLVLGLADNGDFFTNPRAHFNLIDCASKKCPRVSRASFSSELFGCTWGADRLVHAASLAEPIFKLREKYLLCDCRSVVEAARSVNVRVTERRLITEVALLKELLRMYNIKLLHCAGKSNIADCLTKNPASAKAIELLRKTEVDLLNISLDSYVPA